MPFDASALRGPATAAHGFPNGTLETPKAGTRELAAWSIVITGVATAVTVAALMQLAGLHLKGSSHYDPLAVGVLIAALLVAAMIVIHKGDTPRVGVDFIEYAGLLALTSLAGVIASYPIAYLGGSFRDSLLLNIDRAAGFDWLSLYRLVASHELLQQAEKGLYDTVFISPLILSACFAHSGERAKAHLFIASYWLAVVLTLALFAFVPARGPLAVLWHGPVPYMPQSGLYQATVITALKEHTLHQIRLDALGGLVGAPSFHTTAAILFVIAAWPLKRVRWPLLVVNILMLAAIPVEGTHYLADMIGGVLIAVLARSAMTLLLRCPAEESPATQVTPATRLASSRM